MSLIMSKFGMIPGNNQHSLGVCIHEYLFESNSNDSVGSVNGTDTNVSYIAAKINNGADYNGTNAGTLINNVMSATQLDGDFEINFWLKINSSPSVVAVIFAGFQYRQMAIEINASTTQVRFNSSSLVTGSLSIGTWYNISAKRDTGGDQEIWVNNNKIANYANYSYTDLSALGYNSTIGARNLTGAYDRNADITLDSLRIYVPFLTDSQRTLLYNNGNGC